VLEQAPQQSLADAVDAASELNVAGKSEVDVDARVAQRVVETAGSPLSVTSK
jgi:hypothetical protein